MVAEAARQVKQLLLTLSGCRARARVSATFWETHMVLSHRCGSTGAGKSKATPTHQLLFILPWFSASFVATKSPTEYSR